MPERLRKVVLYFILPLTVIFISGKTALSKPQSRSEIIIIGTVHNPTPNFTAEKLNEILKKVNPDLILAELDSSFFDDRFNLLEQYRNASMETGVISAYRAKFSLNLRPYDIEGRNKFYQEQNYFSTELNLYRTLNKLYKSGRLLPEAKLYYEAQIAMAAIRDACLSQTPEIINSTVCDVAVEKKQFYGFKGMKKIIAQTADLKEFEQFSELADNFWIKRNDAMVENIINRITELKPERAVVLCGFEHRYYLRKKLIGRSNEENFIIREYRDY